jgi:hypothetical protein
VGFIKSTDSAGIVITTVELSLKYSVVTSGFVVQEEPEVLQKAVNAGKVVDAPLVE